MKLEHTRLPSETELEAAEIGCLGEVLFTSRRQPPDPIPDLLREFSEEKAPESIDIEDTNVTAFEESDRFFRFESSGEKLRWEPDAICRVWFSPTHKMREQADQPLPMNWDIEFPTEIKTGPHATTRNDQREVMNLLCAQTAYQPMLVRLSIDDLPVSYDIISVEFIGLED